MDTAELRTSEGSGGCELKVWDILRPTELMSSRSLFLFLLEGATEGAADEVEEHKSFACPTAIEFNGSPIERATPCSTAVRAPEELHNSAFIVVPIVDVTQTVPWLTVDCGVGDSEGFAVGGLVGNVPLVRTKVGGGVKMDFTFGGVGEAVLGADDG